MIYKHKRYLLSTMIDVKDDVIDSVKLPAALQPAGASVLLLKTNEAESTIGSLASAAASPCLTGATVSQIINGYRKATNFMKNNYDRRQSRTRTPSITLLTLPFQRLLIAYVNSMKIVSFIMNFNIPYANLY